VTIKELIELEKKAFLKYYALAVRPCTGGIPPEREKKLTRAMDEYEALREKLEFELGRTSPQLTFSWD